MAVFYIQFILQENRGLNNLGLRDAGSLQTGFAFLPVAWPAVIRTPYRHEAPQPFQMKGAALQGIEIFYFSPLPEQHLPDTFIL